MADASVRVATPWDVDAVGAVQAALWREAYASLLPSEALAAATPEEFATVWRESLANPPSGAYRLLVACGSSRAPHRTRVAAAQRDGRHGRTERLRPRADLVAHGGRGDAGVPRDGRVRPRRSPT